MTPNADKIQFALGCDVSCRTVTIFDSRSHQTSTVENTPAALRKALEPYAGCRDVLAVCEASGGYEDMLLSVLAALAIPTHRADAAKVKAFIRSFGTRAKTDPIDARFLAHYALDRGTRLCRWQLPEKTQSMVKLLVARRADLVAMRVQETNRLAAPRNRPIATQIKSHVRDLDRRIVETERQIDLLIAKSPQMAQRRTILQSVPGIGPVVSAMLIATMPELGHIDRRKAAGLSGCAPHPRDSGAMQRHRVTSGGRRQIRPVLFTAALTAIRGTSPLADGYRRLVAAGKPKRLAINAIMRRIVVIANARLKEYETQLT
jgi:transposase